MVLKCIDRGCVGYWEYIECRISCRLGMFRVIVGCFFFFQAEDGIRDLVRSRGLGDVYKRQVYINVCLSLASQ
ncbi:hypothetical protein CDFC105_103920 [Clostridioides difficile]|nr:hypothetical protein CDFC105_103920 [Clostridioides difficile]